MDKVFQMTWKRRKAQPLGGKQLLLSACNKKHQTLNNQCIFTVYQDNHKLVLHAQAPKTNRSLPTLCGQSTTRGPKRRNEAVISSVRKKVNPLIKPSTSLNSYLIKPSSSLNKYLIKPRPCLNSYLIKPRTSLNSQGFKNKVFLSN